MAKRKPQSPVSSRLQTQFDVKRSFCEARFWSRLRPPRSNSCSSGWTWPTRLERPADWQSRLQPAKRLRTRFVPQPQQGER